MDDNITWSELVSDWLGWITLLSALFMIILLISAVLVARKAGYSHWLGVIAVLVPVIGPLLFLVFAIVKWPALDQRDRALALLEEKGIELEPVEPTLGELEQK